MRFEELPNYKLIQYVLLKYNDIGKPIEASHINNILFYLWVMAGKRYNVDICKDEWFVAWPSGPILKTTYMSLIMDHLYDDDPRIPPQNLPEKINNHIRNNFDFLDSLIEHTYNIDTNILEEWVTCKGGCWEKIFNKGKGVTNVISYKTIRECISHVNMMPTSQTSQNDTNR